MGWLIDFLKSSIGKKLMMAATGFCFLSFLAAHLAGNMAILMGPDSLNAYSDKLHSLGPLVLLAEFGLLALAAVHIGTGTLLFFQNWKARPEKYMAGGKSAGGKTWSSSLMPYTGFLILVFVSIHLFNFTLADKPGDDLYKVVAAIFSRPAYIAYYVFMMLVVGLHVRHGFWSAFQTVGANHPKYMPAIMAGSVVLAAVFAMGFGMLPLYVWLA